MFRVSRHIAAASAARPASVGYLRGAPYSWRLSPHPAGPLAQIVIALGRCHSISGTCFAGNEWTGAVGAARSANLERMIWQHKVSLSYSI